MRDRSTTLFTLMNIAALLSDPLLRGLAGIIGATVLAALAALRWRRDGDRRGPNDTGLD